MPRGYVNRTVRLYLIVALFTGLVLSSTSFAQNHISKSKISIPGVHPNSTEQELKKRFHDLARNFVGQYGELILSKHVLMTG